MKKGIIISMILLSVFCVLFSNASAEDLNLVIGVTEWSYADNAAMEYLYLTEYPYASITYRLIDSENLVPNSIGDDIDFLIIGDDFFTFHSAEDYLIDLYEYVHKDFWENGWLDLRSLCEIGDRLYLFPRSVRQKTWIWNDQLEASLGIKKTWTVWNWQDFGDINDIIVNTGLVNAYIYPGTDHLGGILKNYMLDPLEDYIRTTPVADMNEETFSLLFDVFHSTFKSNTLCPISLLQRDEDTQILCMPVSPVAFYQYNEEYADDYILPPCTDITNPRYLGYGSYYCMPKKQHLSDAAIAFLHLLLSEKSVNYFTNAENIFSIRPPRYCVTRVSSKTRLTSEDLEDYQIEDYGITSVTEQYQLFTYQRSHACREQQYHWSEMYPKLLTLIKHAMTDGFHSDTYDEIIKLLNIYQK